MTELILYSLASGLFSLFGGLFLTWNQKLAKKIITPLLAIAAGAFLSAAFLDILPEALEMSSEPHPILLATLVGFLAFFILERMLMRYFHRHDDHDHSEHTESLPALVVIGDSLHNLLDGVIIGSAYVANPALGFTTAIAIAAHEIPQEIGDAAVLIHQGWSRSRIILVNIISSLLTVVGAFIGFTTATQTDYLPFALAAAAGTFIYIAASDLIPELHHQASHKHFSRVILPLLTSVVIIYYIIELSHGG